MAFFLGPLRSLSLYFITVAWVSLACMFLYACKYYILFITVSYSHPYHSLVEASLLLRSSRLHFVFDLQHPHVYQLTSMHILYIDLISILIFDPYFPTALVDEKHDVFGGKFVPTHASSSDYHRPGSHSDPDDFERQNHLGDPEHASKYK